MKLPKEQIRYVDLPELSETFIDSVGFTTFDKQTVRIELRITRYDEPKPPQKPTARQYPVSRLIITPEATVDLFNQLQQMIVIMQKEGLIKTEIPKNVTEH